MAIQDTSAQNMLNAAQIFGYAGNLYSQLRQNQIAGYTTKLDQAQIGLRLKQETLAATQESIASTDKLQEVLASQRAIMGARGQASGQGTALALTNKSIRAYTQEEQNRALATDYNKYQAKAQQALLSANRYNALSQSASTNAANLFQKRQPERFVLWKRQKRTRNP